MSASAFLDTNVLVYAVDENEPVKRDLARALLGSEPVSGFVLSPQILSEFYVAVTRKLARPIAENAAAAMVDQLALLPLVALDGTLVKAAAAISQASRLAYWDGLVVASAAAAGCDRILTEDLNDGQVIASVRIENPFRQRAA
jgi:predicted nucleic acid-binding protein